MEDGWVEYWQCGVCGGIFRDEACQEPLSEDEIVQHAGHVLEHDAGQAASCEEAGYREYWFCTKCGEVFADAAGEESLGFEPDLTIPAKGHTLELTPAQEASCDKGGNEGYYTCATCGKHFGDAKGENEIEDGAWATRGGVKHLRDGRRVLRNAWDQPFDRLVVAREPAVKTAQLR